jgi:hypothetical protein
MGWSEVAARSHARRLESDGWLCRYPMKRGERSLFVATWRGVRMTDLPVTAAVAPAATWWAHLSACAWVAAWLTSRGREIQGSREVLADPSWTGMLRWQDHNGVHRIGHRPDLAWLINGQRVAIEVELAQKSIARLRAILDLHADWRAAGKSAGVIYVCADEHGCARIRERAAESGLHLGIGGGLRVEPFETIKVVAVTASVSHRVTATAGGPNRPDPARGARRTGEIAQIQTRPAAPEIGDKDGSGPTARESASRV